MAAGGFQPGDVVAGYTVERMLGKGGMGAVYLAADPGLPRKVALKVLVPWLADDPVFRQRFNREWQISASLEHPNVVPIYNAGEADGVLFIAMRYVDGTDLGKLLHEQRRLTPERTAEIVRQVAGALDTAHAAGLIHRDVKPENILIGPPDGHVLLTDFGLAKLTTSSRLTVHGTFLGTAHYCSPEQIQGGPLDGRTDVYALGCVAFHCLAGQPPYPKDTDQAVTHAHVYESIPLLSTVRPGLSAALDGVIKTAMAKRREDRFATARELAQAFDAALGDAVMRPAPAAAPPPPPGVETVFDARPDSRPGPTEAKPRPRGSRRGWWIAAAALGAAALAGGALAFAFLPDPDPKPDPPTPKPIPKPTPVADIAGRLDQVVARQQVLNTAVVDADANAGSLAPLKRAANAVANSVVRMQGFLSGVPVAKRDRADRRALNRALSDQLAYARTVRDFPSKRSSFTDRDARSAISLAGTAQTDYAQVARLDPTLPVMPLARADHTHLLDLVPPPVPPKPTEVRFMTRDGRERCVATKAVVRCSGFPSKELVQLQPGGRPVFLGSGQLNRGRALPSGQAVTAPGGKIRCDSNIHGITCTDVNSRASFTIGDSCHRFSDGRSTCSPTVPTYTGWFVTSDGYQQCWASDYDVTCYSTPSGQGVTLHAGSGAGYLGYTRSSYPGGGKELHYSSFRTPSGAIACTADSRGITCTDRTGTGETFSIGDHYVKVDGVTQ